MDDIRPRCGWCNLSNPVYVAYHDAEWAVPSDDDHHLFEMLVLETFRSRTVMGDDTEQNASVSVRRSMGSTSNGSRAMTRTRSPNS